MKLTVDLFGVPRLEAGAGEISVELPAGANLADLVGALAERRPELVGRVIRAERDSLVEPYAFYIEGIGFVDEPGMRLRVGSRVALMLASAGG